MKVEIKITDDNGKELAYLLGNAAIPQQWKSPYEKPITWIEDATSCGVQWQLFAFTWQPMVVRNICEKVQKPLTTGGG